MQALPVQAVCAFSIGAAVKPAGLVPHLVGAAFGVVEHTAVKRAGTGTIPVIQFQLGGGLQQRLGMRFRLAFFPLQVGLRNQEVIHKKLPSHRDIDHVWLVLQIGYRQRFVQRGFLISGRPNVRQYNVVI